LVKYKRSVNKYKTIFTSQWLWSTSPILHPWPC